MPVSRSIFAILATAILLSGCGKKEVENSGRSVPPVEEPTLIDAAGREYIWNIEHRVNLIKELGLSRLAAAIESRDSASIQGAFPPDFKGSAPAAGSGQQFQSATFSVRSELADSGRVEFGRGPFVRWLLDQIDPLKGDLKARTHVITLAPSDRDQLDGRWVGTGKIEVSSRDADGELAEIVLGFDFAMAELNEERLTKPGWLSSVDVTRFLLGKTGQSLMRDATAERGIRSICSGITGRSRKLSG